MQTFIIEYNCSIGAPLIKLYPLSFGQIAHYLKFGVKESLMEGIVFSDIAYYGRFAAVGVIALAGTISNGISLSFFLRNQRDSIADKHLIALNITDLLICAISPAALFCLGEMKEEEDTILELIVAESFVSLSLFSCFLTTMLNVLRAIVLKKPLYIIRENCVYLAHSINAIFSLGLITSKVITTYMSEELEKVLEVIYTVLFALQYLYVLITVGIVGNSSVIVVRALRKPPDILPQQVAGPNRETNRKATVMILTLSVVFVFLNGSWCVFWAICTVINETSDTDGPGNLVKMLVKFVQFLSFFLIAINSCANPLVYMLRNSRLNNHTKSLVRGLKRSLMGETENAIDHATGVGSVSAS